MKQNNWFDPFFILENLSPEEKLIQKNVKDLSNNVLRPTVVARNRDHMFDKDLYKKFVHPAGFFLGGQVVLEIPSTNSELLVMTDNIAQPPPPLFVEGTATYQIPNGLVEQIGFLPDDADSDTVIERISLKATVGRYKDMQADIFAASYGRIDQAKDINSPTMDDSAKDAVYQYGVRMSNDVERMDRNRWFYDSDAGNPRYMTIGYVDSDYVELT